MRQQVRESGHLGADEFLCALLDFGERHGTAAIEVLGIAKQAALHGLRRETAATRFVETDFVRSRRSDMHDILGQCIDTIGILAEQTPGANVGGSVAGRAGFIGFHEELRSQAAVFATERTRIAA